MTRKYFLNKVTKHFFPYKNVYSWHKYIFLTVRKNLLLQEKTVLAVGKNNCHYQEKISWHQINHFIKK